MVWALLTGFLQGVECVEDGTAVDIKESSSNPLPPLGCLRLQGPGDAEVVLEAGLDPEDREGGLKVSLVN